MTFNPSIACFGLLAAGMIATENPSLAASLSRSCPRGAGLTSPANPTSPNDTSPTGRGLSRSDDKMANKTGKSAAGSVILTPPTALTNTS